jgi:uncharacterized protein YrrD
MPNIKGNKPSELLFSLFVNGRINMAEKNRMKIENKTLAVYNDVLAFIFHKVSILMDNFKNI